MPSHKSSVGCGNTLRTVEQATTQSGQIFVNNELTRATDENIDYSKGQPLYVGTAQCDPARDGSDQIDCCKD